MLKPKFANMYAAYAIQDVCVWQEVVDFEPINSTDTCLIIANGAMHDDPQPLPEPAMTARSSLSRSTQYMVEENIGF
jgi:hypothetical protein